MKVVWDLTKPLGFYVVGFLAANVRLGHGGAPCEVRKSYVHDQVGVGKENHGNIMENHRNHGKSRKTSWKNHQWKITNGKSMKKALISASNPWRVQATSPRLALGKARAAFAVPWPRECPGFHGPTHEPKKRGLKKWPSQPPKIYKNILQIQVKWSARKRNLAGS